MVLDYNPSLWRLNHFTKLLKFGTLPYNAKQFHKVHTMFFWKDKNNNDDDDDDFA